MILLDVDTTFGFLLIPVIRALGGNLKLPSTIVNWLRLLHIDGIHILKLYIATALNLQNKRARSVDVYIFKFYAENFAFDERDCRI